LSVNGNAVASGEYVAGDVTTMTITGLTHNTPYYFVLTAVRNSVESAMSEVVIAVSLSTVVDFISGSITKIKLVNGYNILSLPCDPKHLSATTLNALKTYLGTGITIYYTDGVDDRLKLLTSSTVNIVAGGAALISMAGSRPAKFWIGDSWSS
jgi:hypothetical protein